MRPIGFSTGALAKGDFRKGIALQRQHPELRAIELSALRDHELPGLASSAAELDVQQFDYVSVHAPSKLSALPEDKVFAYLERLPAEWPIIAHPLLVQSPILWRSLGPRLCLENMDNRKGSGRTVAEMQELFDCFPEATFCLDLGHARQIDPTMATALRLAKDFSPRLRQLHVSEVGRDGEHLPLSALAIYAFQLVAPLIPDNCAVIIESVIGADKIEQETRKALGLFAGTRRMERSFEAALELTA